MKRSKRTDSENDFLVLEQKFSEQDTQSDRYVVNNPQYDMKRMPSFHQNSFEPRQSPVYKGFNADHDDGLNVDDVLLERNDQNRYGNFQFLGLALVFGAVGLITMYDGSTMTDTII